MRVGSDSARSRVSCAGDRRYCFCAAALAVVSDVAALRNPGTPSPVELGRSPDGDGIDRSDMVVLPGVGPTGKIGCCQRTLRELRN